MIFTIKSRKYIIYYVAIVYIFTYNIRFRRLRKDKIRDSRKIILHNLNNNIQGVG